MNFTFVPTLQHAAIVRTASLLYHPKEFNLSPIFVIFSDKWHAVEMEIVEKLSSLLPDTLQQKVSKVIRPMHLQVQKWTSDHYFIEKFRECSCTHITWKMDGTIDKTETAKKIIANENIDSVTRFIMACTYFLEDEILEQWEKFSVEDKERLDSQETNLSVRFWIEWLQQENKRPWLEVIDEYFRVLPTKPFDIPVRVGSFYHFLSRESKNVYMEFLDIKARVHSDDFRIIVNNMDETERIEIFSSKYLFIFSLFLEWPFRCVFVKKAKETFSYMTAKEFMQILGGLFRSYDEEEYEDFELFEEFWEISPDVFKDKTKKSEWLKQAAGFFSENKIISQYLEQIKRN